MNLIMHCRLIKRNILKESIINLKSEKYSKTQKLGDSKRNASVNAASIISVEPHNGAIAHIPAPNHTSATRVRMPLVALRPRERTSGSTRRPRVLKHVLQSGYVPSPPLPDKPQEQRLFIVRRSNNRGE